jgi:hypothetical protein
MRILGQQRTARRVTAGAGARRAPQRLARARRERSDRRDGRPRRRLGRAVATPPDAPGTSRPLRAGGCHQLLAGPVRGRGRSKMGGRVGSGAPAGPSGGPADRRGRSGPDGDPAASSLPRCRHHRYPHPGKKPSDPATRCSLKDGWHLLAPRRFLKMSGTFSAEASLIGSRTDPRTSPLPSAGQ